MWLGRAEGKLSLLGNVFLCRFFNYLNYQDISLLQISDKGGRRLDLYAGNYSVALGAGALTGDCTS